MSTRPQSIKERLIIEYDIHWSRLHCMCSSCLLHRLSLSILGPTYPCRHNTTPLSRSAQQIMSVDRVSHPVPACIQWTDNSGCLPDPVLVVWVRRRLPQEAGDRQGFHRPHSWQPGCQFHLRDSVALARTRILLQTSQKPQRKFKICPREIKRHRESFLKEWWWGKWHSGFAKNRRLARLSDQTRLRWCERCRELAR